MLMKGNSDTITEVADHKTIWILSLFYKKIMKAMRKWKNVGRKNVSKSPKNRLK